jgi:hypothetical protein
MSGEIDSVYFHTKNPPEGHSTRLYHFERGCEPWGFVEDDVRWYRIQTSYWFGDWIETQDRELWKTYGGRHRAIYIIREELMTIIQLQWL